MIEQIRYYDSDDFPYVGLEFLTDEECQKLIDFTENNLGLFDEDKSQSEDFWSKRVIDYKNVPDPEIKELMVSINDDVCGVLSELSILNRTLYPDTLQIVRWYKGYELTPHADRENPDNSPHPFSWRDFATVVYLNDDYEGGEIYWPNKDMEYKPVKGSLAIFPGTKEFLHGVREVPEGVRYTIASFFTYDKTKALKLP